MSYCQEGAILVRNAQRSVGCRINRWALVQSHTEVCLDCRKALADKWAIKVGQTHTARLMQNSA